MIYGDAAKKKMTFGMIDGAWGFNRGTIDLAVVHKDRHLSDAAIAAMYNDGAGLPLSSWEASP